jgi:hypothetical protein
MWGVLSLDAAQSHTYRSFHRLLRKLAQTALPRLSTKHTQTATLCLVLRVQEVVLPRAFNTMNLKQPWLRTIRWIGLTASLNAPLACDGTEQTPGSVSTNPQTPGNASVKGSVHPAGVEPIAQDQEQPGATSTTNESGIAPGLSELVPAPEPWQGPFLGITRTSVGIYAGPSAKRSNKIGYAQEGALLPVKPNVVKGDGCDAGYYEVVGGGYICSEYGTTNVNDPRVTNAPKQPNLDAVLPFTYARNSRNGAPLYRAVPSREQQKRYEPYLFKDELEAQGATPAASSAQPGGVAASKVAPVPPPNKPPLHQAELSMLGAEALKKLQAAEEHTPAAVKPVTPRLEDPDPAIIEPPSEDDRKWWQKDNVDPSSIKLADLSAEGDDILAQRLVKGFFIAVDRKFQWNGRQWFRSTKGFVAPTDTFGVTVGPKFQGVPLSDEWRLPLGWVVGYQKTRNTYEIDPVAQKVKLKGSLKRLTAVNLTGKEVEIGKHAYVEVADQSWLRKDDVRIATPGPTPADLSPNERWLDINLTTQTAILLVGNTPVYATLISSGKTHPQKDLDHRSPTGEWRIREKHITSTMDGDGTAAGDMPYSIEAVPYVMFFHRSYAVHGAFWHENYGVKMSHGCINMSPLDAKYMFFHTDPEVPQGWQGAWSSDDRPGSRVVIHE